MDYNSSDEQKFSSNSLESSAFEFTQEERAALSLFPPVLSSLVELRSDGWTEKFFLMKALQFSKDKNNSGMLRYCIHNLCDHSHLSPDTKLQVLKASKKIVEGEIVDLSDPRLTYDAEREKAQKYAYIDKMPFLLCQQCKKDIDNYHVECLLACIMPESFEDISMITDRSISSVVILTRYINYYCKEILRGSNSLLSPHTVVRTVRQLHNLIFNRVPVPQEIYDEKQEIALQKSIQDHFPSKILATVKRREGWLKNWKLNQLTDIGYLLLNPADLEIIIPTLDENAICEERKKQKTHFYDDIKRTLKDIGYDKEESAHLTREFIERFALLGNFNTVSQAIIKPEKEKTIADFTKKLVTPVGMRIENQYHFLVKLIAVEKDSQKHKSLVEHLEDVRKTLHAQALCDDVHLHVQLSNPEGIASRFQEAIPACSVCLQQLSGYFTHEPFDTVAEAQLPCSHKLCVHCVVGCKGCCPVCRSNF